MKTAVITGATDGIGRALALYCLGQGEQVVAIGSSRQKGKQLLTDAQALPGKLTFMQADLSSVRANRMLIAKLKGKFLRIDMLVLCAYAFKEQRQETAEGLEMMFSLNYLSRFILSFGLVDLLDASPRPVLVNVAGAGMNGHIRWDDLQSEQRYSPFAVTLQNSHLNDILGAAFAARFPKVHYVLFNPVFVRTPGLLNSHRNPLVRIAVRITAKLFARSPEQTAEIIANLSESVSQPLSLYKQAKAMALPRDLDGDVPRLTAETKGILRRVE